MVWDPNDLYSHDSIRVQDTYSASKKRKKRCRPTKRPGYPKTLALVRRLVQGFVSAGRTEFFYKENIARVHELDPSRVQRALGDLRHEGLVHPPVRGAFAGETWRGGGYDETSAWSPTRYYAKIPGHQLKVEQGPRMKHSELVPIKSTKDIAKMSDLV